MLEWKLNWPSPHVFLFLFLDLLDEHLHLHRTVKMFCGATLTHLLQTHFMWDLLEATAGSAGNKFARVGPVVFALLLEILTGLLSNQMIIEKQLNEGESSTRDIVKGALLSVVADPRISHLLWPNADSHDSFFGQSSFFNQVFTERIQRAITHTLTSPHLLA